MPPDVVRTHQPRFFMEASAPPFGKHIISAANASTGASIIDVTALSLRVKVKYLHCTGVLQIKKLAPMQ